ncbi:glycosyltransferase family 87 protein [Catellatospora sp. KI3]|uniref:glycosyltransferase family 87 protein n=1 Tax=Catellatospora sp. KI3 TaxID=3041620 RepID=UPI0024830E4F|nr:glycosyltransferase family 87 protein [Catellatospora sp. KI3]MDI1460599.1 glycosyltransferase family 87 protein [Catellatospora sp. KI3]
MSTSPAQTAANRAGAATGIRVAIVVVVAAVAAFAFQRLRVTHDFFDLKIYLSAVRWWGDGNELYDYAQPDRVQGALYFTYPPFAAALLFPFGLLPTGVVAALFTAGTVAAVLVTTYWLVAPLARRWRQPAWFAVGIAAPLVLLIEPLRETLTFGQINMLLIVLIMLDLLVLGPRGSRWTGVGIGLATAIKLIPGLFIVYLLVTRQWRAAVTAAVTAAGATLLAAAVAPRASWQFWTSALWDTARVGRLDYTGNQSLQGLLARLVAPHEPAKWVWLLLALAVLAFGLWRAAKAGRAGDVVAALALTGLLSALISPITWPHHLYWFVPAVVALVAAGLDAAGARRWGWLAFAAAAYAVPLLGVVSLVDWGVAAVPTDTPGLFLARNAYVLAGLVLVAFLPIRDRSSDYLRSRAD